MYHRHAGSTSAESTSDRRSFVIASGMKSTFAATLATATSKQSSHEKPTRMPRAPTRERMDLSTFALVESRSASVSRAKISAKARHVMTMAKITFPMAPLLSPPRPSLARYSSMPNMMHQEKTKLHTRRIQSETRPSSVPPTPMTLRRKIAPAKSVPITAKTIISNPGISNSSGKLPSALGRRPWTAKRMHCTARNERVSPKTSSSVSSVSSSHISSVFSFTPSPSAMYHSRPKFITLKRHHSSTAARGSTRSEPMRLSLNCCCRLHHAAMEEKPVMCPSSTAQHFMSSSMVSRPSSRSWPSSDRGGKHLEGHGDGRQRET
mmetsp:Transcript_56197/g.144673  ORF Transcript_56197/g.144673 Transcript_56197/m.144673 type:complete len:321 (+) Transcript_56197:600-1562(+)